MTTRTRAAGIAAVGVVAAAALALAGTRAARRRRTRPALLEPRGEAHMWGIIAAVEPAEQVLD